MAEKDIAEKVLFDYPDVVADVMNVLLFDGRQVVRQEEIVPTNTRSQYKIENELHEEERDNLMIWRKKGKIQAYIGTEHQTESEKYETIRTFGYDGTLYKSQFTKKNERDRYRRKKRKKIQHTDFYPVLTMILYYGMHHWKYRSHLKELLKIPEELKPFISDYSVNSFFEIAWLTPQQVQKFQSDFQVVADYFVQMRMKKEYTPSTKVIIHVDATLKLMTVLTKTDWRSEVIRQMQKEGKEITMVSAYAEVEKRGLQKGIELGKAQMKSAYAEVEKRGYDKGVEYVKSQMKSAIGKAENKSISETRRENAEKMLKDHKLSMEDVSRYSGLSLEEVRMLNESLQ